MSDTLFPLDDEFEQSPDGVGIPLADRMRPRTLEEVLGQPKLIREGRFLREVIRSDEIPSMIFWGPPGVGKTSLAHVIAGVTRSRFVALSAVLSGIKDVKKIVETAQYHLRSSGRRTILFVDEIHRFNKAQQDAFLPHVEKGAVTLIGATTENPSFEVIAPLLSRTRVVRLEPLDTDDLREILRRALQDPVRGLGETVVESGDTVLTQIAVFANGDARMALNSLEIAVQLAMNRNKEKPVLTSDLVEEALQKRMLLYDKSGEEHFNLISALHKSLRNSDVDASLYWLGRMLEAGEDPLYVARRMVRFASEDVGLADPDALGRSIDALQAIQFIGLPEGKLALAQLAVYLAQTPKSNAVYTAYGEVEKDVQKTVNEGVPLHLRNAPTALMKNFGYGQGYRYAHDEEQGVAAMDCLPSSLRGRRYYRPGLQGYEATIARRLTELDSRKKKGRDHLTGPESSQRETGEDRDES